MSTQGKVYYYIKTQWNFLIYALNQGLQLVDLDKKYTYFKNFSLVKILQYIILRWNKLICPHQASNRKSPVSVSRNIYEKTFK